MKTTTQTNRPELSFDGCGINGPDEHRTRIATFFNGADKYGPLFASAPELLAALESITKSYDALLFAYGKEHGWGTIESDNARAAIQAAKGGE